MKKILWCTVLISIFLCGCSKNNRTDIEINRIKENIESEKNSEQIEQMQYSTEFATNLYKHVVDETTGESKYGLLLGENITYSGKNIELGADLYVNMGNDRYTDIPLLCMLLLDGKMIPFSIDNKEEADIQYISIQNGEEKMYPLNFKPVGVSDTEIKKLLFIAIPFYNYENTTIFENDILYCEKNIVSLAGELVSEDYESGIGYFIERDLEKIYNKSLKEISEYNGELTDYIIQNDDSKIYYMGDYDSGEYETFLFCDGQLYGGFDNRYYLKWSKAEEGYVNKEIDMGSVNSGRHILFTMTVCFNDDGGVRAVVKAINKEVIVNET